MFGAPLRPGDRRAELPGTNGGVAIVHAVCRQRPKVLLLHAKPHECSRIASKFTVRPDFDVTVKYRRKFCFQF